jgi:putative ABC transport system ATP-binding protein
MARAAKNRLLNNIELAPSLIEKNTMLPIMGPSGQGKSTLLYLLASLKWPSQGKITWVFPDGQSCILDKQGPTAGKATKIAWLRRERFGFSFQNNTLSNHLTVAENVAYPRVLQNIDWATARQDAKQALQGMLLENEREQIDSFMNSFPSQLSGGQQQRVALAQAIVHKPWVLFADEPTGQLDYHTRLQVMGRLKNWVEEDEMRHRLIWVTHHHTDDLEMMGLDTLLFVENGRCELKNRSDLENWKNKVKALQQQGE